MTTPLQEIPVNRIDGDGRVIGRLAPDVAADDPRLLEAVDAARAA